MIGIFYKAGDKVEISNTTIGGKVITEGIATLVRFEGKWDYPPYPESWQVKFEGDTETFIRSLTPGINLLKNLQ